MRYLLSRLKLEALEPGVRAAAEDLDSYARAEGLAELELVDPPCSQRVVAWADSGCVWAVRRDLYSRRQRAMVLQRLMKGRRSPEWEIWEEVDRIICLHRNFTWRGKALAHEKETHGP